MSNYKFHCEALPMNIVFTENNEKVGFLDFGPPMTFEGDAEESARLFFEQVIKLNNKQIKCMEDQLAAANARVDALQEQVEKLQLYAWHTNDCNSVCEKIWNEAHDGFICDCGFAQILEQTP